MNSTQSVASHLYWIDIKKVESWEDQTRNSVLGRGRLVIITDDSGTKDHGIFFFFCRYLFDELRFSVSLALTVVEELFSTSCGSLQQVIASKSTYYTLLNSLSLM